MPEPRLIFTGKEGNGWQPVQEDYMKDRHDPTNTNGY